MLQGYRPGTRRNKRSQAAIYTRFCESHGLNVFPADEWQLCRYAAYTATQVTTAGTVENYVGGVHTLQQLAGYPALPLSSPNLKLLMEGIKVALATPLRQAVPVTKELLLEIAQKIDWGNPYILCNYSAALTGFYMCLRKSNLVPVSTNQFDPVEQLTRGNVSIDPEGELMMVHIEWSKMNQHKKKDLWVLVSPVSDEKICPIRTM